MNQNILVMAPVDLVIPAVGVLRAAGCNVLSESRFPGAVARLGAA